MSAHVYLRVFPSLSGLISKLSEILCAYVYLYVRYNVVFGERFKQALFDCYPNLDMCVARTFTVSHVRFFPVSRVYASLLPRITRARVGVYKCVQVNSSPYVCDGYMHLQVCVCQGPGRGHICALGVLRRLIYRDHTNRGATAPWWV